ncbi:hypothetical protein PYCCODRAFT_1430773 [Trametes coccinea BRFM310]|uniref:Uncharacterized protein n=1 Tax=Trametes coccinea (strain BRFM310) TaxID=1353009 RepID=A0A1Y2J279_TRAC3|nr:hypothetical protein PYCCODRAFT_1430773 [Trametes coccinea BRFM310]
MSGSKLAEGAASQSATTVVSEDYAAALRAAALKTLKPKKRHATISQAEPMLPQRPLLTVDSIELDYGQEEPSGASSIASSPTTASAKAAVPQPPIPEPMQVDNMSTKEEGEIEEGEISDSEMAPPTPKANPLTPLPGKESGIHAVEEPPISRRKQSPPMADLPHLQPPALPQLPSSVAPATLVDENHVRPGLALTQAQYDTAKDIILDLLGWGVPPEYLVSCGLSREIVFYVFVELNLRLPSNLDTTGLPPIPIPSASQAPPSTVLSPRPAQSHPSLPSKPPTQSDTSTSAVPPIPRPLSATAPPFVPSAVDTNGSSAGPSSASLHDMEQQRRQELLARKAVLASRKLKKKSSPAVPSSHTADKHSSGGDRVVNGIIPTKAVEDFLQSIEPATEAPPIPTRISPPSMYDMDIDDVPGLTTTMQGPITEYTPLPRPPAPASLSISASNFTTPRSPVLPQSAVSSASDRSYENAPSASSASFSSTPLSYDGDAEMDAVPGLYQPPPDERNISKPRRGTKRPVASDFVDMDSGPSRAGVKTPTDFSRANIRRKTTGFAGLTQRRCIIDLSDSEAEEDNSMKQDLAPLRTDSRGPKAASPQPSAAPTPRHHSPKVVVPAITPAILEEKEAEIRRMRELIAQREQNRKKKLAASTRSTPVATAMSTNGVPIKQEDDDSARLRSFEPSRSGSSATPDPATNGRPHDSQDERSVLAALLPHETGEDGTVSLLDSQPSSSAATPTGSPFPTAILRHGLINALQMLQRER